MRLLRELPSIHELQKDEKFQSMIEIYGFSMEMLTKWVQEIVSTFRQKILKNELEQKVNGYLLKDLILNELEEKIRKVVAPSLTRVINASGVILHTNLGRAKLSDRAIEQVMMTAKNYSNLEYNLERGKRGSRHDIIEEVIKEVTGAEAAMVVNNNAAAVFLILKNLAKNREVIVSRGELVEIGGSFRVSSIMEESQANLIEIGTTNKTHYYDYENAITEETVMIMKVHTSNFKTIGFTKSVTMKELVKLKEHQDIFLYEDLGSGALYDFGEQGIGEEPTVREALDSGADIVSFSGDKLLGGPQAGIIAGKKSIIDRLKKDQLARVLRVDKMTLAALEATLLSYVKSEDAIFEIPTVKAILEDKATVKNRATRFHEMIRELPLSCEITEDVSEVGGGTMPGVELETTVVFIKDGKCSAQEWFNKLKDYSPPIITRIQEEKICLDFRAITEEEIEIIASAFKKLVN